MLQTKPDNDSGFASSLREAGPYLGLGLQLAATILGLLFLGDWIDKKFNFKYVFTLIFGFFGIGIGIYNLIKTVNELEKKKQQKNENK